MLNWILYAFIIVVIIVVFMDSIPVLRDWFGRIHIGRYEKTKDWNRAITNVGARWLNHTPTIKLTDHSRLIFIDMIRGNYSRKSIQYWQEAALLLGLSEYLSKNEDKRLIHEILRFMQTNFNEQGQWRQMPQHVDVGILAYGIMNLGVIEVDRYKPALDEVWRLILAHVGSDGTVEYRKHMSNYRYVDTIGFICPFLIKYGLQYQREECISLAVEQIRRFEQNGMLEKHYIPGHAYNIHSGIPVGLYGWGRGLGWYAIGLIDSWNELPDTHASKRLLEDLVRKFARTVLTYQNLSGSWNWSVNRTESRSDSSTVATLGWFLQQASQLPDLKEECMDGEQRASAYLMKMTRRKGAIDFSQGDTKDLGVYSTHFNVLPFTQGFSIRLANARNHTEAV